MFSADSKTLRVLVVAPHPDDETLGCGGTVHRLAREGATIRVLVLAHRVFPKQDGYSRIDPLRAATEARAACQALGISDIHFAGFSDRRLPERRQDLLDLLEAERDTFQPNLVFIPDARDTHQDHRMTHEVAQIVWRPHLAALNNTTVLAYQAPSSYGFTPAVFLPVWPEDIAAKQHALACYESETLPWPHTRSLEFLEVQAKYWGGISQLGLAEVFDHVVTAVR